MADCAVLVLADDLTGALEIGALFARRGVRAAVTTRRTLEAAPAGRVLVIDTETRHRPAAEAAAIVEAIAARAQGVRCLYKKTDSTLRGNIAAELAGLLRACPEAPLAYAPGYPAMGRTCRDGLLRVQGVPVHETAFAGDPLNPVMESHIPTLLERANVPVAHCWQPGVVTVHDSEDDDDLRALARAWQAAGLRLAAGPGGFAAHLADVLALPAETLPAPPQSRRLLTVCGSLHPASIAQAHCAEARGVPVFTLTPEDLVGDGGLDEALVSRVAAAVREADHAMLRTVSTWEEIAAFLAAARTRGLDEAAACARAVARIGQLVRAIIVQAAPEGLIVFGGDTTLGILQAHGEATLYPATELLPGIPLSRVVLGAREMVLVTKAGGFGDAEALCRIAAALRGRSPL